MSRHASLLSLPLSATFIALLTALLPSLGGCASGSNAKGGDDVECYTTSECATDQRCEQRRCVADTQNEAGSSGNAGDGGSGGTGGSAGDGGSGGTSGSGGTGGSASGSGGSSGTPCESDAEWSEGVHCKFSADGCTCTIGGGTSSCSCGSKDIQNSVCCASSGNWPDEGTCSCLSYRSVPTNDGCVLALSNEPVGNNNITCGGELCCLSNDKLGCQCYNSKSSCPANTTAVDSCSVERLGCGDSEQVSDCHQ